MRRSLAVACLMLAPVFIRLPTSRLRSERVAASSQREHSEISKPKRIFVSIVAFLDPELPATLKAMLAQAERPELLTVGLVWQGLGPPLAEADLEELAKLWQVPHSSPSPYSTAAMDKLFGADPPFPHMPPAERVSRQQLLGGALRVLSIEARDARGCHWARYLAQLLWDGEEWYLQLDSHMRFVRHWDTAMRQQLKLCYKQSDKPVLSNYGRPYALGTPADWQPPPEELCPSHICGGYFDEDGILHHPSIPLRSNWSTVRRHVFWSGHFAFSSSAVLEVPFDPQLPMAHFPEEPLMAVRLYTNGWDVFCPTHGLVFHLWERDYRRTFFEMKDLYQKLYPVSLRRVHSLLDGAASGEADGRDWPLPGIPRAPELRDPFGLGTERSLQDFEREADLSFRDRRLGVKAYLGNLPPEEYLFALIDPVDVCVMILLAGGVGYLFSR